MATIKEIAQLAGVSRGTVDRVLNGRGGVTEDTAQKVREIAQALNYSPSIAGKTLAVKKKQLKFGFILFSSTSSNPFFSDMVRGIESRAAELSEYGVTVLIRYAAIDKPELQVALIDELVAEGIHGLAITPINHASVVSKVHALTANNLPVVTVNSDIPQSGRIAYVGSNYAKSGETAAGLMNIICGGRANVGVIIGSPWVLCHSERASSFTKHVQAHYPGIQITATAINNDDDIESYTVTTQMLQKHPEIDALYLAAAGAEGACRAVQALGLQKQVRIVGYDATQPIRQLIEDGSIIATISQQPFTQGARPLDILLDYTGMDKPPEKEYFYTKTEIKIKENLDVE